MHQSIIEKTDSKVSGPDRAGTIQPGSPADSGKNAATSSASDTVVLTNRGQLLERLEKTAADLPAVDQPRVEAVKADIASGNYQIDADNIADILLRTEPKIGD